MLLLLQEICISNHSLMCSLPRCFIAGFIFFYVRPKFCFSQIHHAFELDLPWIFTCQTLSYYNNIKSLTVFSDLIFSQVAR